MGEFRMKELICSLVFIAGSSLQAEDILTAAPGRDNAAAVQQAVDALPAGREHIATLKLIGRFELERSVVLPDYTRLDLTGACLKLAAAANAPLITNSDAENGNRSIEICGGILDGNRAAQSSPECHGILLVRTESVRIADMDIRACRGDGIRLTGTGRHTRHVQLRNLQLSDNLRCGLNVMWAMRSITVSDVFASGNGEVGIRSDHSEGFYQNISADANNGSGIFIRNIFGGTYNNLTATRNGGMGIHVQGMVASRGSNWGAHNNSTEDPGRYADIFFDADASLSYGMTKQTVLNNIMAGPYREYGPASEKVPVEFGEGVREGLQIGNLLVVEETQ
jgi:hypothetical protein